MIVIRKRGLFGKIDLIMKLIIFYFSFLGSFAIISQSAIIWPITYAFRDLLLIADICVTRWLYVFLTHLSLLDWIFRYLLEGSKIRILYLKSRQQLELQPQQIQSPWIRLQCLRALLLFLRAKVSLFSSFWRENFMYELWRETNYQIE